MSEMYIPPQKVAESELLAPQHASLVRAVAMAEVRQHARTVNVSTDPRAHRFVLYDDSGGEVGSDLTDVFLGVSIAREGYLRRHIMRVSFLEMLLSEATRYSNRRTLYMFDWQEGEPVFARKKTIETHGEIIETRQTEQGMVDIVVPSKFESLELIGPSDCNQLCEQMVQVTESVRQKVA